MSTRRVLRAFVHFSVFKCPEISVLQKYWNGASTCRTRQTQIHFYWVSENNHKAILSLFFPLPSHSLISACFSLERSKCFKYVRSFIKHQAAERKLRSHLSRTFVFIKPWGIFSSIGANYFANSSLKAKPSADRTTYRHEMSFERHDNLLWWMCGPI